MKSRLTAVHVAFVVLLLSAWSAYAGQTGGAEFQAATDDLTQAGQGYGGFLISLLGGASGLITGIAAGQVRSALSGLVWAFIPATVIGVIAAKYSGLI